MTRTAERLDKVGGPHANATSKRVRPQVQVEQVTKFQVLSAVTGT